MVASNKTSRNNNTNNNIITDLEEQERYTQSSTHNNKPNNGNGNDNELTPFQLKVIGVSSIYASVSFIVGFGLYTTVLSDIVNTDLSNEERFQSLKDNDKVYYLSNMILYILFGIAQLILTVGLAAYHHHESVVTSSSSLSIMLSFVKYMGIIWCVLVISTGMIGNIGVKTSLEFDSATEDGINLWIIIRTLHSSLGGSNEIIGGIWVLLTSWYQYKYQRQAAVAASDVNVSCCATTFDKIILCLGILAGIAGIVSTIPVLSDAGAGFGVCMILWYLFTGIQLIRSSASK